MDDGARKKRKLALAQNLGDSKDAATDKDSTARKRERERILLARASVIKEKYRRLVPAYDAPWKEPPSSTTHWDHLLSEAVWMWNDMAQERLWKEAVAKQLAYEAQAYWRSRFTDRSSVSSSEIVTIPTDEVFGIPFGRQFRAGLQEMARKSHRKKTIKYEKSLRKFQREYETGELAAIYGFEPDEEVSLLNIKIPTLPCIAAPDEAEKDYYAASPPKSTAGRRSARNKGRSVAAQQTCGPEEMLTGSLLSCRASRPPRETRTRTDKLAEAHGSMSRSRRNTRRRASWLPGSDISLSQPELETRQDPPTINDFLARYEDQLLFFASAELEDNWQIVSDVMASAGIYMTPDACRDRLKSIEGIIAQAQSQLLRPRTPGVATPGSMEDILLKQLRGKAKEILKRGIPEMQAAKYTPHTSTAHKKRILKLKKAMHEGNIGPPSYHISQIKLSENVVKAMGGRLATPKESWTKVHNQNVARQMAVEFRKRQIDAAEVAARQIAVRAAASQPPINGGTSLEAQQKYRTAQQPGSVQLAVSLGDPGPWGQQGGIQAAFMRSVSGGSMNGAPVPGQVQTPWIPPPADSLKGMPTLPNFVAKGQGQPVMEGPSIMPPLRPGLNLGPVMPQHLMGGVSQIPPDQPMPGRPRVMRPPQHQMPMPAGYTHQNQQYVASNNPALLRQYLHSNNCHPVTRRLIMKTLQDSGRSSSVNAQMPSHPTQTQQRTAQQPPPQAMAPSKPHPFTTVSLMELLGGMGRMPVAASSGDPYASIMGPHSSFPSPSPAALEHPSQFTPRAPAPNPRDYEHMSQMNRPRSQRPSFPPPGYDLAAQMDPSMMHMGMPQGAPGSMFGAMPLRMHGGNPDLMHPSAVHQMELRPGIPVNSMDPRPPLHGTPQDAPVQMLDPTEARRPDVNFPNDNRSLANRQMHPYQRNMQRPFGN